MTQIIQTFLDERDRWFLWLPVFMGCGVGLYFSWPFEPPLWASVAAAAIFIYAAFLAQRHFAFYPLMAALMVMLGHTAANVETLLAYQPMLQESVKASYVKGRVMVINHLPDGYRIWIDRVVIDGLVPEKTPARVRVKIKYQEETPRPGEWVKVKAMLYPLSLPPEPGAFNFRQNGYFQGYGGTGFSLGKWYPIEGPPPDALSAFFIFFEKIRTSINQSFLNKDKRHENAVAMALITGDQSGIDKGTLQSMRVAGISHILSVSGLHITLVAGIVFYCLRFLLALIPWVHLHWPIKKIAAFFALAAAVFYTLMCAAPVPAVRSMLMSAVLMLAIMTDRRALSMRLVAVAALVTLLGSPSSLLDPSFQLSFAAVMALIAAYEKNEHGYWAGFLRQSPLGKAGIYMGASVLTSLVATIATTPLILFHFQQMSWYGVLANLIAVPLSSFIIMPAAIAAVLLMPFNLQGLAIPIMQQGISWMLQSAQWVAELPGSVTYHPAFSLLFLLLSCAGGLWFCLWQKHWRWLGLVFFMLGGLGFLFTPRPDVLVADDGLTVGVRGSDGRRIIRTAEREDFTVRTWLQRDGQRDKFAFDSWFDVSDAGGGNGLICAGGNCLYDKGGWRVAFPVNAQMSCAAVNVVVAGNSGLTCPAATTLDKGAAAQHGAFSIFMGRDLKIKAALPNGQKRYWD